MKKKGFTLIETLICIAIVGIIVAIAYPNIVKNKEKGRVQSKRGDVVEVQQVKEQVRSSRISITKVGSEGSVTYYIVKDLNPPYYEYLVGRYMDINSAGLAIVRMEK